MRAHAWLFSPPFLGLILRMATAPNARKVSQSVSFSQQYPLLGIPHSGLYPPACSGRPRAVLGCCLGPYGGARLLPAPEGPVFLSFATFSAWATPRKMGLGGRGGRKSHRGVLPHSGFLFENAPVDLLRTKPHARKCIGSSYIAKTMFSVDVRPA